MKSNSPPTLHTFGLDDPSAVKTTDAAFIDTISTVIAVDGSRPLTPSPQSLEAIREKISFTRKRQQRRLLPTLLAWSGWAAAIVMGFFAFSTKRSVPAGENPLAHQAAPNTKTPTPSATETTAEANAAANHAVAASDVPVSPHAINEKVRTEQRSLIQEIATLRDKVKLLQQRDHQRVTASDGVIWPIIVKMSKPGEEPPVVAVNDSLLSGMIKDMNMPNQSGQKVGDPPLAAAIEMSPDQTETDTLASSAIPIYDPARDNGQLMVNNLPAPGENQSYFLWVDTDQSEQPVLVGALPPDLNTSSETFQFKLGSTGVIPTSFRITLDPLNAASSPSSTNTILQGPK